MAPLMVALVSACWVGPHLTRPAPARLARPAMAMAPPQDVWNDRIRTAWASAYASYQGGETEYEISDITGALPKSLRGTVWRNGPGNFERGNRRFKHILDGDGLICRISFEGDTGRASFKSAFVRTAAFEAEEAADAVLYRNTFGTQRDGVLNNAGRLVLKNVANTNVVRLGSKLLALWEAGPPIAMETGSMATVGEDNLGGALEGEPSGMTVTTGVGDLDRLLGLGTAFTAHPRLDPASGRLVGFSWASTLDQSAVEARMLEFDPDGRAVHTTPVTLRGTLAPHDFALTADFYVFVHNCMEMDLLPFVAGTKGAVECLRTTGGGVTVQLVPRPSGKLAGTPEIVVHTDDPYFAIHHAAACDGPPPAAAGASADGAAASSDGALTLYTAGWPNVKAGPFLGDWGGDVPLYDDGAIAATQLFETVIRPDGSGAASLSRTVVADGACIDHPHCDPRFDGSARLRYFYMSYCNDNAGGHDAGSPPVGWMRYDRSSQGSVKWRAPSGCFCEEIVVLPKQQSAAEGVAEGDVAEDAADAWLAGMMFDSNRGQSCLCILDGADVAKGPVCQLWLAQPVPHGLHGSWEPGAVYGM